MFHQTAHAWRAGVRPQVESRRGAPEFYAAIEQMARDRGFRLHYVSAREMVNILHAAEDGHGGDAGPWRDYIYSAPPLLRPALVP